jgi:hypothetical protein
MLPQAPSTGTPALSLS